jgi:hypothetical protein
MATTTTESAFSLNLWAGIPLRWILVGVGTDEVAQVHTEGTFRFVRFALVERLFLLPGGMLLGIMRHMAHSIVGESLGSSIL